MVFFIPPNQRRVALLAAQADSAPVMIHGGSGTGKGALARWIHQNGPRAGRPCVETRADRSLTDEIPLAHGGTLVIHEIAERGFADQKALLRFFKTKTVAGGAANSATQIYNVRVIATTSHSLENRALGGLFNPELLSKLSVFPIQMPALAHRDREFAEIAQGLLEEITRRTQQRFIRGISADALEALRSYDWPGNVRELRNVLLVAARRCESDAIEASDLPDFGNHRHDLRATREQFQKFYVQEVLNRSDYPIDTNDRVTRIDRGTSSAEIEAVQDATLASTR